MVSKIQNGTKSAVSSMQSGVSQVSNRVELANQAGDSINRIRDGAQRVTVVVNGISDSISEQSMASNEIARKLETIAQMSGRKRHCCAPYSRRRAPPRPVASCTTRWRVQDLTSDAHFRA